MAFVNKQGGDEKREDKAAAGMPIDFDPNDDSVVKVHYDLSAWNFDQRGELAESLADAGIPHAWDGEELIVPEEAEAAADKMFEVLEAEMGPFPIGLDPDAESSEFKLEEWSDADRQTLTVAMVEAEIPHRWDDSTVSVDADAESAVDDLLDAIESGELSSMDADAGVEAPAGALSEIFLASNKLAKDPFDAKSRRKMIELNDLIDQKHPPYALPPRVWGKAVLGVGAIVKRIAADADGDAVGDDDQHDESSDVIGLAQELRATIREYV